MKSSSETIFLCHRVNFTIKENYLLENFGNIPLLSVIPDMMEEKGSSPRYGKYGKYATPGYDRPQKPVRKAKPADPAKKAGGKE